jgi:hypothetical protein
MQPAKAGLVNVAAILIARLPEVKLRELGWQLDLCTARI